MVRTVLITGAAGGIGKVLCSEFVQNGYHVIATDIVADKNKVEYEFIEYDLEKLCHSGQEVGEFASLVRSVLPSNGLDVLINNAAIQIVSSTRDLCVTDWIRTLNVNLTAPFILAKEFLPELEDSSGCIINIASVHAHATKPGFVAYASSKAGLVGLTRSMAVDLGGKVRVNAINPAATRTDMLLDGFDGNMEAYEQLEKMHPVKRIANPEEIAKVAVFLASENSGFITGAEINVDGGILSRLHDPE